jgi:hypothetical protein
MQISISEGALQLSLLFEIARSRCINAVSSPDRPSSHAIDCDTTNEAAEFVGNRPEQTTLRSSDEEVSHTQKPNHQEQQQKQQQQQSPAVTAAPDDVVLVAGMHAKSKKIKSAASMSAALALLSKDSKAKKKGGEAHKAERASNLLIAANVVQKCGIASGAPLVFSAPEHIDVYPRQVMSTLMIVT